MANDGGKEEGRKEGRQDFKFYFKSLDVKCVSGFSGLRAEAQNRQVQETHMYFRAKAGAGSPLVSHLHLLRGSWRWSEFQPLWGSFHVWPLKREPETHKCDVIRWELALHLRDCARTVVCLSFTFPHTRRPESDNEFTQIPHMPGHLCCEVSDGSDWASVTSGGNRAHGECECAQWGEVRNESMMSEGRQEGKGKAMVPK